MIGLAAVWTLLLWLMCRWLASRRGLCLGRAPVAILSTITIIGGCFGSDGAALSVAVIGIAVGAVVDQRCGYIFDPLVAGVLVVTTIAASLEGRMGIVLGGAAATFSAMLFLWIACRGRALGLGDVKFSALIGGALGPLGGVAAIGAAFVLGAGISLVGLTAGRLTRGTPIRFGPYLLAGSLCHLAYHRLTTGVFV